jgi:hypothetical protein
MFQKRLVSNILLDEKAVMHKIEGKVGVATTY